MANPFWPLFVQGLGLFFRIDYFHPKTNSQIQNPN